jgi:hypothetical protein
VPVDLVGGTYTVTVNRDISHPVTLASGTIASPILTVPLSTVSLPGGNYIVNFVATHLMDASHARIVVGNEGVDAATLTAPGTIAFTPGAEQTTTAYPSVQAMLAANPLGQLPSCSACTRQVVTTALPVASLPLPPLSSAVGDQCGNGAVAPSVALSCAEQLFYAAAITVKTAQQSGAGVSVPVPTVITQTSLFNNVNEALQQADDCVTQTDPTCAAIVKDLEIHDYNNFTQFVDDLEAQALQEAANCAAQTDPTCAMVIRTAQLEAQAVETLATTCLNGTNATCTQLEQLVLTELTAAIALADECVTGQDSTCATAVQTAEQEAQALETTVTGCVSGSNATCPGVEQLAAELEGIALGALNNLPDPTGLTWCAKHQPQDGGTGTYCTDPCPGLDTATSQTPFDCTTQTIEQDGIPALRGMADRVAGETTTFSLDKSEQSRWDIEYRAGVGPFSVSGHNSSTDTQDEGETWPVLGDCWSGKLPTGVQHEPSNTGDFCSPDGATEMQGQDAWKWEKHYGCQNEGSVGPYYCTNYETEHQQAFDGGTSWGNQGVMSGYYADPLSVKAGNQGEWSSYLPGSIESVTLGKQHYYSQAVHFEFNPGSNYGGVDFKAGMSQQNNTTVTNHMAFRNTAGVPWNYKFYRYDIGDSPFGQSKWTSEMASGYIRPSGVTSNYPWPYGT